MTPRTVWTAAKNGYVLEWDESLKFFTLSGGHPYPITFGRDTAQWLLDELIALLGVSHGES